MSGFKLVVTGVLLCLIVCSGLVVKRQNSRDDFGALFDHCKDRSDSCVQNSILLVSVFASGNYDRLVVDGQFGLKCEVQDLQDLNICVQVNAHCLQHLQENVVLATIRYMCGNKEEYVRGSSCWNNGARAIKSIVNQCLNSIEYCLVPACVQENVANIPVCTEKDATDLADALLVALGC